jgi:hypothetical protein
MAVQAINGVSSTATIAPTSATEPAPADAVRRGGGPDSKDSTIVISKVTKTRDDGSTVTTLTYADGHTKVETTPPKFSATEDNGGAASGTEASGTGAKATEGDGRVTAVDILA